MSSVRFVRKLREQLRFLKTSCDVYDTGDESEGLRIATALRILFHDTKTSTSLVSHLRMEGWEMLSSDASTTDMLRYNESKRAGRERQKRPGLDPSQGRRLEFAYINIQLELAAPTPVRAVPNVRTQLFPTPLKQWWAAQTVCSFEDANYARRDLVLCAANKDGGAHVDHTLLPFSEDLERGLNSLGLDARNLEFNGPAPYDQTVIQYCQNTHVAMLRQFGHEVLATAAHYKWIERLPV